MKKFGSAVILAGGKSSRMGFDKKDMCINNKPLMITLVENLRTIFDEVILITNKENKLDIFNKVSSDMVESSGPLSGIYTGLKLAKSKYVYFIACDMPVMYKDYILYMKSCLNDKGFDACVTRNKEWIEPFNAFYSKDIADNIKDFLSLNRRSIYGFVSTINTVYIDESKAKEYSKDFDMFYNLNTKEDVNYYIHNIKC